MIQPIDYYAVAPPLILALTAGLVLLLDVFLPRAPYARPLLGIVTLAGVTGALAVVISQAVRAAGPLRTFCVPPGLPGSAAPGPGAPFPVTAPETGAAPPCSFVVDGFTLVFAGLALAAGIIVVLLSMTELSFGDIPAGEWHFLLLCTLTGAVALPASRDLVMLVVALELASLPVFALTALRRYDGRGSEAAVKLFLVSVVSTAVMLFGISLLYGLTGTVYLERLARVPHAVPGAAAGAVSGSGVGTAGPAAVTAGGVDGAYASSLQIGHDLPPVLAVAAVLVLAGFAFKVAAVPFHAWAGDVYEGAPIPVAALLSVVSKAAGFAGLILVLVGGLRNLAPVWAPLVAVVAALTMTAGNLLALRRRRAVRLLAWSSVAQSGYILAPLAVRDERAMNASVAYLAFYAAMNLGAFAVVMLAARRGESGELDGYRGFAARSRIAGPALAFFLICLAGLPPGLAGLFAKIVVFRELVGGGPGWLAAVMAVNTVIGLYYYVAWVVRIFTPAPVPAATTTPAPAEAPAMAPVPVPAPAPGVAGTAPEAVLVTPGAAYAAAGDRTGQVAAGVAIALAAVVAVLFSVAPQTVFVLLPETLITTG
ncbi:NADH-quinone oxidoreductase subunit N [Streptosporangium sandarakinum]|uniref:NADH-quinone oxidoreductase subunit N n=1 Tax=Streptosporangium sandarakinum TaxID=1260955 RepID=UPI00369B49E9